MGIVTTPCLAACAKPSRHSTATHPHARAQMPSGDESGNMPDLRASDDGSDGSYDETDDSSMPQFGNAGPLPATGGRANARPGRHPTGPARLDPEAEQRNREEQVHPTMHVSSSPLLCFTRPLCHAGLHAGAPCSICYATLENTNRNSYRHA